MLCCCISLEVCSSTPRSPPGGSEGTWRAASYESLWLLPLADPRGNKLRTLPTCIYIHYFQFWSILWTIIIPKNSFWSWKLSPRLHHQRWRCCRDLIRIIFNIEVQHKGLLQLFPNLIIFNLQKTLIIGYPLKSKIIDSISFLKYQNSYMVIWRQMINTKATFFKLSVTNTVC